MYKLSKVLVCLKIQALQHINPDQKFHVRECCEQMNIATCSTCEEFYEEYCGLVAFKTHTLSLSPEVQVQCALNSIRNMMIGARKVNDNPNTTLRKEVEKVGIWAIRGNEFEKELENLQKEETYDWEDYEKD